MLKFVLLNFLFVIKSLWLYFTLLILQCRILGWSIFVEKYIYYGLFFRNNKKMVGTRGPNLMNMLLSCHKSILCFNFPIAFLCRANSYQSFFFLQLFNIVFNSIYSHKKFFMPFLPQ